MTRDSENWTDAAWLRPHPEFVHFRGQNVIRAQVDSIRPSGQRDVGAGVDQESSSGNRPSILLRFRVKNANGVVCQGFQFARRQILLTQLNIVDAGQCCFRDLVQQTLTLICVASWELSAICDVAEQATWS